MRSFLLFQIRKYGPISTAEFKSDLRTMARNGIDMGDLDENKVIRTLDELAADGLIKQQAGGWVAIHGAKQVQQTMFGGSE
jgi:hypothetical protein